MRDVEPGEIVVLAENGMTSCCPFPPAPPRFCIFEYIYFARPDSLVEGASVYEARKRIGAELARESGVSADVIVPVPDSGVPAALGYAERIGASPSSSASSATTTSAAPSSSRPTRSATSASS